MSYTSITGMRSNRYPLMGMGDSGDGLGGCGCRGVGADNGNGSLTDTVGSVAVAGLIGVAALGALYWGMQAPKSYKQRMSANRRRRRRRTSRR